MSLGWDLFMFLVGFVSGAFMVLAGLWVARTMVTVSWPSWAPWPHSSSSKRRRSEPRPGAHALGPLHRPPAPLFLAISKGRSLLGLPHRIAGGNHGCAPRRSFPGGRPHGWAVLPLRVNN
jgi:hypothetical protein